MLASAESGTRDVTALHPVASSAHNTNIMTVCRPATPDPGAVVWFVGYEAESYADFCQLFLYVLSATRDDPASWTSQDI